MRPPSPARALFLALILSLTVSAQFVAPEGVDFRNGSTLPAADDGGAEALVLRLQRAVAADRADEAAFVLRTLRSLGDAALLPLGRRTHVPALDKAARLLMDEATPALRERVLDDAREQIAAARRFRDLPRLLEHASSAVSLPTAAEAAGAAARLAFEEGRWWDAWALARRAGELPGASQIAAAARERARPAPSAPLSQGPWRWVGRFPHNFDEAAEEQGTTMVLDGRQDEVLMLDAWGLQGLDLVRSTSRVESTFEYLSWPMGSEPWMSVPAPRRWTAVLSGERLVLPFNVVSDRPLGWRSPRALREARLLAVDLDDPPRLAWMTRDAGAPSGAEIANGASSAPSRLTASSAHGPVVVAGDRIFSQVFRVGLDTEVSLTAHDVRTGALLFETPLVRGTFVPRFASRTATLDIDQLDKREREGEVAVLDGVVWACTGFGVVAAVDGVTGRLLHTFRYERLYPLDAGVYAPAFLFDTGGWEHEPVRIFGDRIVVAPSDSRFLYVLAKELGPEGQLILDDPIERLDRRSIVELQPDPGGSASPAVLCTRQRDNRLGLMLIAPGGHTLAASPLLDEGEEQTGRPVVLGRLVLVPTNRAVRVFRADDLTWGPGSLPMPPEMVPVLALRPCAAGLLALVPSESDEDPPERAWSVLFWRQVR